METNKKKTKKEDKLTRTGIIVFAILLILGIGIFVYSIYDVFQITATTNSTYQGIVQAIYTHNQSSTSAITFTTGLTWHGNLSRVSNLSIGADCTLTSNEDSLTFSSGACK